MPEGPELHLSSQFINAICKNRIFTGKVRRNPIHKCADVLWDAAAYTISAVSRGKELKVFLQSLNTKEDEKPCIQNEIVEPQKGSDGPERMQILFNFGMSGKFEFTSVSQLPKHAHLSFYTKTEPAMALSFVDYRRFGKWQVGADWSPDRGPCVMFEYPQFRSKVLNGLSDSAFNKPLCEVLLNQKYFNGIGNYLRAEICFRAGIRPFEQARSVFVALPDVPEDVKVKIEGEVNETSKLKAKTEGPDILELCNMIPLEVVGLGTSLYLPEDEDSDMSKFSKWLQCYYKPGMKNVADHNKRTMWFYGDPGPLLPKEGGSRKRHGVYDKKLTKSAKKMKKEPGNDGSNDTTKREACEAKSSKQEQVTSPAKAKRATRASLKKFADESLKKSTKQASTENTKGINVKETYENVQRKSKGKRTAKKAEGKTEGDVAKADDAGVVSKVRRRATASTRNEKAKADETDAMSKVRGRATGLARNEKEETEVGVVKAGEASVLSKVRRRATGSARNKKGETECGMIKADKAGLTSKVRRRVTRATAEEAAGADDFKMESPIRQKSRK